MADKYIEYSGILNYYLQQSLITDPAGYTAHYANLPTDIPGLVRVVQGLVLHVGWPPIRCALLHDFDALNKVELVGFDAWHSLTDRPEYPLNIPIQEPGACIKMEKRGCGFLWGVKGPAEK